MQARVSEELVGTRMKVKLLEVDEETERLVFSNRRASSETQMAGHKVTAPNSECLQRAPGANILQWVWNKLYSCSSIPTRL